MVGQADPADEQICTAYHEAGHAVISVMLRLGFHYVTIAPDAEGDTLGHVQYCAAPARLSVGARVASRDLRDRMLCNRAGPIAEACYAGRRNDIGAYDDDLTFAQCLRDHYGARRARHARDLTRQAQRLVAEHWGAIERVAAALTQHHMLSYAAVTQLVGAPPPTNEIAEENRRGIRVTESRSNHD
jgi:Peptidase family M41